MRPDGRTIIRPFCLFALLFVFVFPVYGREVAGVVVPEEISGGEGGALYLNGAGVRSKFFLKIYIAELYLQHPSSEATAVIGDEGQKIMVMHFIYDEVTKEKLTDAWNEGFKANIDQQQLASLQERIIKFNSMFDTVKRGDRVILEYLPGKGTRVIIRNQEKGLIAGKDFSDALLAIWLGKEPVSSELRKELLNYSGKK
jgi:hypothetical protein